MWLLHQAVQSNNLNPTPFPPHLVPQVPPGNPCTDRGATKAQGVVN